MPDFKKAIESMKKTFDKKVEKIREATRVKTSPANKSAAALADRQVQAKRLRNE